MQIPLEWYNHIVPGLILLTSIYFLLPVTVKNDLIKMVQNQAIGSVLVLTVSAYILGLAENAFILYLLRPAAICLRFLDTPSHGSISDWVTFHQLAQSNVIQTITYGYQNMVLHRSLVLASCTLLLPLAYSLRNSSLRWLKLTAMTLVLVASVSLYLEWKVVRNDHIQFSNDLVNRVNNQSHAK